jgi:hypothetical protein
MTVDISPILQDVLSICVPVLTVLGSWALTRLATSLGVTISAGQRAQFEAALHNALAYGVTRAIGVISANGWDHPDVKSLVVASGLDYMITRFPDALAAVGLRGDLGSPENIGRLQGALERALPGAILAASASPATPPATSPPRTFPVNSNSPPAIPPAAPAS